MFQRRQGRLIGHDHATPAFPNWKLINFSFIEKKTRCHEILAWSMSTKKHLILLFWGQNAELAEVRKGAKQIIYMHFMGMKYYIRGHVNEHGHWIDIGSAYSRINIWSRLNNIYLPISPFTSIHFTYILRHIFVFINSDSRSSGQSRMMRMEPDARCRCCCWLLQHTAACWPRQMNDLREPQNVPATSMPHSLLREHAMPSLLFNIQKCATINHVNFDFSFSKRSSLGNDDPPWAAFGAAYDGDIRPVVSGGWFVASASFIHVLCSDNLIAFGESTNQSPSHRAPPPPVFMPPLSSKHPAVFFVHHTHLPLHIFAT